MDIKNYVNHVSLTRRQLTCVVVPIRTVANMQPHNVSCLSRAVPLCCASHFAITIREFFREPTLSIDEAIFEIS